MLAYKDYEKAVFDWLYSKYKATGFTFSIRRKISKGAEGDYFTGTENSNYFGTTFWFIPVGYPGSNGELIQLNFTYSKERSPYVYYFEFIQTSDPDDLQNKAALKLIENLLPILEAKFGLISTIKPGAKIFNYKLKPIKASYDTVEEMFRDIDSQLNTLLPLVDENIKMVKTAYPNFKAGRISKENFEVLIQKGFDRIKKYKNEQTSHITPDPVNQMKPRSSKSLPLNLILFGPPGTGKTYKLKRDYFEQFTIKQSAQTREQFLADFVSNLTWWQIITLALLELGKAKVQEIYEHELVRSKASISSSKTVRATLWGQLQSHTVRSNEFVNKTERSEPLYFEKDGDSYWSISHPDLQEKYPEAQELYEQYKNYQVSPDKEIKNYEFITFHQSFSYEDFIEGIKPAIEEDSEGSLRFRIQDGVFKRIAERARRDPENKYALFIDEINRGNVSAIFGELITLIEDSKRAGQAEALEVTLPYSKEKFSVPANLHLIGTMNTADRSVEALDTALRRRFTFEEMLPNPDINELDYTIYGYSASEVLKTINLRIEKLLDREHCIGHAYFIGKDESSIISSFYKNIIPLLQEYFFGDYGKIGLVLGKGFVRLKHNEQALFADFPYDYVEDLAAKPVYEIIQNTEESFAYALAALMNND